MCVSTHRSLEHGVVGLEAVGAFLPEIPVLAALGCDVASHTIPCLCDEEVGHCIAVVTRKGLGSCQARDAASHHNAVQGSGACSRARQAERPEQLPPGSRHWGLQQGQVCRMTCAAHNHNTGWMADVCMQGVASVKKLPDCHLLLQGRCKHCMLGKQPPWPCSSSGLDMLTGKRAPSRWHPSLLGVQLSWSPGGRAA